MAVADRTAVAPEAVRLEFRRKREAAGYSRIGLSRLLGRSSAYVAHIESGRLNPSPPERAKLAEILGESPETLFAGFRKPQEEVRAEAGAGIVQEYDRGASDRVIAQLLGMSPSGVRTRRLLSGRQSRPNNRTFQPPAGNITAKAAADTYELDHGRLCEAIEAGIVPGQPRDVAGGHPVHTVVESALAEYLANRPQCAHEGCKRHATIASEACSGPHARALETKGTKRPGETCRKISTGKKGKPRPDVVARVADLHADPEKRFKWLLRLIDGRKLVGEARRRAMDRATESFTAALRRRRGGAPRKEQLHGRWLAMFNGEDAELEELLAGDTKGRVRMIAWLDWQRHPEDWPRNRWPASRFDPEDIEPNLLPAARERVKKALQNLGKKPIFP